MTTYLMARSTWFHALAMIVKIGNYLFTSQIFVPTLESQMQGTAPRHPAWQQSLWIKGW